MNPLTKTTIYATILGVTVLSVRYACAEDLKDFPWRKEAQVNAVTSKDFLYKLTGFSTLTNERVIAYLNPLPTDPSRLEGLVHDNLYIYPIQAIWNGKGTALAKSFITTYQLEVIE